MSYAEASATISDCGLYRYSLTRRWADGPTALFIMLNPSTATATEDDVTLRRCIGFAKREGCGALRIENLFAFRATNPSQMFALGEIAVGDSDRYIDEALSACNGPVIVAWGGDGRAALRAAEVMSRLASIGAEPKCLGTTQSGAPCHPSRLPNDRPLISFPNYPQVTA